jgi:hypothetical protein
VTARSLAVTAEDTGSIFAVAGALAGQWGSKVALAAGVSVAFNEIGTETDRGQVMASIDGATVSLTGGDLTVTATNDASITSWTIAGTGQVAKGTGAAWSLAGAGAGNTNSLAVDTVASITGTATVTTDGHVTLAATDSSKVDSNAGGVGLGIALGAAAAVGVTVGAARNVVSGTNSVRAAIETGSVTAGGDVSLTAHSKQQIDALAFGVAVAIAGGDGTGVALSGSGASSTVELGNTQTGTTAEIVSATVEAGWGGGRSGSVRLHAVDTPTVTTEAGAGSLSVGFGATGWGLAVGIVPATTVLQNAVTARIVGASGKPAPTVTASGSVDVSATSAATVTTRAVAVAVSAAFSPEFIAGAAAGTYAKAAATITNTITAEIAAGSVTADAVSVSAATCHSIASIVGAGSSVFSVFGGSVGWSASEATVNDTVNARISGGTVTARAGDVTVEAGSGNTLSSYSIATSIAVAVGGGGTAGSATSKDSSSITAEVGSAAQLEAKTGTLRVRVGDAAGSGGYGGYGSVTAKSEGGSLGLITVGRVSASAEHSQTRLAVVRGGADLVNVQALDVDARSRPDVKAVSFAVDIGVGLAVQDNESIVKVGGSTTAETETDVTLPGAVRITADAVTTLAADQRGGSGGGVLGYGGNSAKATSEMKVAANLGAGNAAADGQRVSLLWVAASHIDQSNVYALAGAGGIGGGVAMTKAALTDNTTTSASIGAAPSESHLAVGTLYVSADREQRFATQADSYFGAGIIGSGVPSATFTTTATAQTTIHPAANIEASGRVVLTSHNLLLRTGSDLAARVAGGSIIGSGSGTNDSSDGERVSGSVNTVTTSSKVVVGTGARINQSGSGSAGGISILPTSDIRIADGVGAWGGGVLSVSTIKSQTSATVRTTVEVDDNVTLAAAGDLAIGTTTVLDVTTSVTSGSAGAVGVANFRAATTATVDEKLSFGKQATLSSAAGDVRLTAGEHAAAAVPGRLNLAATVDAWTGGLITSITVETPATLTRTSSVTFGADADVTSAGGLRIAAAMVTPTMENKGVVAYYDITNLFGLTNVFGWSDGFKESKDKQDDKTLTSTVNLGTGGTFIAGSQNEIRLTVPETASSGTISAEPAMILGKSVSATYDAGFDPLAFIAATFSEDAAAVLAPKVPAVNGGWRVTPIEVRGGSIDIRGDTLAGTATLAARTGQITVTNDSPHHLLLDSLRVANTDAGKVTWAKADGSANAKPGTWSIPSAPPTPSITIAQTHVQALDASGTGPAVFLTAAASNPRGLVSITNARGSLGVLGTIAAKDVDIRVPFGAAVFDVKGAKHAGGPPATSQPPTSGTIATIDAHLLDANKALSYAINALYPSADDAALNARVYPAVTSGGDTRFVFWGGGAPGVTSTTGDVTAATARALMALFRTDSETTPFSIDGGSLPRLQRLATSFTADAVPSATGSETIKAQQIAIFADTLNVNGDLVVGDAAAPTRSVVIPTALQAELAAYRADWKAGRQASPIWRIPAEKLGTKAAGDAALGVTFDAASGQLLVDEADIGAGARLTLVGKIINTSPDAGRIKVESGGGGVAIDNLTLFPVVTRSISTPGTGLSTTVRIVDMLKDASQRQTIYQHVGGEILVYRGAASADLLAGPPAERLSGTATYAPLTNARWKWSKTATLERDVQISVSSTGDVDGSTRTVGGWNFANPASPWTYGAENDVTSGSVVVEPGAAHERTITAAHDPDLLAGYGRIYHTSADGQGRVYAWPWEIGLTVTDSVRADHPITIAFDTGASQGVSIRSTASVQVAGDIAASSVSITSNGQIQRLAGQAPPAIAAGRVVLEAGGAIGLVTAPIVVEAARLTVLSTTSSVVLDVNRGSAAAVVLESVEARSGGGVTITAGGDILAAATSPPASEATIRAGRVALTSTAGGIGSAEEPLRLASATAQPVVIERLTAPGAIHVDVVAGDALVGTVTSQAHVGIAASGSLYDGHTWTFNPGRQSQIDRILADLGMADTDAAIAKGVATFQADVKSRYVSYWALKNDGVVFDGRLQLRQSAYGKWATRTAAALGLPADVRPTGQQVLDHAARSFTDLEDFFTRTVGGGWRSLAAFQTYDAAWTHAVTDAQRQQVITGLGLDARALLARAGIDLAQAARPWDPAVRVGGSVNVTGTSVALVSRTGTVGKIGEPVTILARELRAGTLSAAQELELGLAGRRGDAVRVTDGFRFRVLRPIVVAAGTRLDAEGALGVALAAPGGDLAIGRVATASGGVDIAASGEIVNAPSASGIAASLTGTTTLFSRTGSIGAADSKITVSGGPVVAGALDGDIHIATTSPLTIEEPPLAQPGEPGEAKVPEQQSVDRVDFTSATVRTFALGGATPGTGVGFHDQLVVAGEAILDGTIAIKLSSGYVPAVGDRFTIMTYGSVRGQFVAGQGLFGLADDLWFEIEQTGNHETAGGITLVVREFLPGAAAALRVAEAAGAVAAIGARDQIGMLLNRDYFGLDLQVAFEGSFTIGEVEAAGRVALRYAPRYDRYEMSIDGRATIGSGIGITGEFLASVGIQEGGTVTSVAIFADEVDLEVALGGTTLAARRGRVGLLVSDAGYAFEAAAGISARLSPDLSLYADEIRVFANPTATDYSGVMFTLDTVTYTFGTLAADSFGVGVTAGEIIAGGFLRASGSFALKGSAQQVTLADGSRVTADVLTIGGENLGGFAGTGAGTQAAVGVTVADVDFGVALVTEQVAPGTTARRWITAQGTGGLAEVTGVTGVTGSLTNTALALNLAAADGSLVDYSAGKTSLTVETTATSGVGIRLAADGTKGQIVRASGTAAFAVEGELSVSGTVGLALEGSSVVVVGTGITARLGPADAETFLEVSDASFGLVATGTETAFELSQGAFSAAIAGFAGVSADAVFAQYTSAVTTIAAGRRLDTGTASYTFTKAIAADTVAFAVDGFAASIDDFISLSGSVGFRHDGSGFVAVGRGITATLDGGELAAVSLRDGRFGLAIRDGMTALEISGADFDLDIAGFDAAAAETVFFRKTSSGMTVAAGERLDVGGVTYTFAQAIQPGTTAFSFTGLAAALPDFVSLSGDVGFALVDSGSERSLIGLGSGIEALLSEPDVGHVKATRGSLGLISRGGGLALELRGGFEAAITGLAGIAADTVVVQYGSAGIATVTKGTQLAIGAARHTFAADLVAGATGFSVAGFRADVAGFVPLSGSLGFAIAGDSLVAVGDAITAGGVSEKWGGLAVENGRFGLVTNASGTVFELGDAALRLVVGDLAGVESEAAFARFATQTASVSAGRTISAGGLGYTFREAIQAGTRAAAVRGFAARVGEFVSLAGDVGFSVVGDDLVAVASDVSATLAAGEVASLAVHGGTLGLRVRGTDLAFEISGGTLAASIEEFAGVSAERVVVRFVSEGTSVAAGETLAVGPATYTFAEAIAGGTVAFDVEGLSAKLFDAITVSGDIGFRLTADLIAAYATGFTAAFTLGDEIEASVRNASFDLRIGAQILFALQGEARLKIFDVVDETVAVRIQPDYTRLALDDGSQVNAAVISFAAALPDLFFGVADVGLVLDEAVLGFAVATDLDSERFWVAAQATAGVAGFTGIDAFTATAADASVVINTRTNVVDSGGSGRAVNWSVAPRTLQPVPLGGAAPAGPIRLDMRAATLAARGTIHANLLDLATLDGTFSFETSVRDLALTDGTTTTVDALALGIREASGFLGFSDDAGRTGLVAEDVNLAFGVFTERGLAGGAARRQWSLLDADVGRLGAVGVEGVVLEATGVSLGYVRLPEDLVAVDLTTPIAADDGLAFSLRADQLRPGSRSLFTFGGDFDVNLRDHVVFQDRVDLRVELDTVQVFDPATGTRTAEEVATLSFAALGQDIFAGSQAADGDSGRVGLAIDDADLAAVIAVSPSSGSVWVAVDASAAAVRTVGIDGLVITTDEVRVRLNSPDLAGRVIDFAAAPLEVPTGLALRAGDTGGRLWSDGQSATIALAAGTGGEAVIEIADARATIASAVHLAGDLAFRIADHTGGLVVSGLGEAGTRRIGDRFAVLSLAATDASVFVGAGTPSLDPTIPGDFVGLAATGIDVGYAVFTDLAHVFDALALHMDSAAFVGLGDTFAAALAGVSVARNAGVRLADLSPGAIDFRATFGPAGYELATPGDAVALDFTRGVQVEAAVERAELVVDGFLSLSGALAFSFGEVRRGVQADPGLLKLIPGVSATTLEHDVSLITVGGANLEGFAGLTTTDTDGSDRRIGLAIEEAGFGMAIMVATSVAGITLPEAIGAAVLPVYVAAKAEVSRAGLVGTDDIVRATVEDVSIEINTSTMPQLAAAIGAVLPGVYEAAVAVLPVPAVRFTAGDAFGGTGLLVATGDAARPVLLDFSGETVAAEVGWFEGTVGGSLQAAGSLALAKRGSEQVTLTNGRQVTVNSLGISLAKLRAFAGLGNYWGRNPDTGRIDGTVVNPDAAGIVIDDLDLGGVFMLSAATGTLSAGVYAAAHASLASARIHGIDGLTAEVRDLVFDLNAGASTDLAAVDFSRSRHSVVATDGTVSQQPGYAIASPGAAEPLVLAYDRALARTRGAAAFNLGDTVVLDGLFDLSVDASTLGIFFDGSSRIGPADGFHVATDVEVVLVADRDGVAARAMLDINDLAIGSFARLETDALELVLNTTGRDVLYTIPESLREPGGASQVVVSAISPGGTVAGSYVSLTGAGRIVAGSTLLAGSLSLLLDREGVRGKLAAVTDVGFGTLAASGDVRVLRGADDAIAFVLDAQLTGRAARLASVDGRLLVNTGATDVTLGDGTVAKADTDFDARLAATIDVGLFMLDVGGRMSRVGDVFELRVDRGTLDFFDVVRLDVTGFYRSTGAYLFAAGGEFTFTTLGVTADNKLALSLARDAGGVTTFRGEMAGATRYDWGWLGSGDGPAFRSYVTFGPASAAVSARLQILGVSIPIEFTWQRSGDPAGERPDPVIARLEGGVLTLSAGDDPERYGDTGGQWYGSITNETFRVDAVRDITGAVVPGSVRVRSQGVERVFAGVTRIVADGGEGNDLFEIGPGVDAELRLVGGPGGDTFIVHSFAAGSLFAAGSGYDTLVLPGALADYRLTSSLLETTIAPVADESREAELVGISVIRLDDGAVSPSGTLLQSGSSAYSESNDDRLRAYAGPIVNSDVHVALRTYQGGQLVRNLDLIPDETEPNTVTDTQGTYQFPADTLSAADRNGDGVVDFRDGMVLVGSFRGNGSDSKLSAVDSISGSDLGFPLVGLPGGNVNLATTLRYAGLLRWRPDMTLAGLPVTPQLLDELFGSLLADAPETLFDGDFSPYVALGSADAAEVARGVAAIRFEYSHLINVLTVIELLRELGLDLTNEDAWGYRPDPLGADRLEIIGFSSYGYAIATRFGEQPLDYRGRPAVAARFDPLDPTHVRAVLEEIIANYPTERLFALEPDIEADFLVDARRTAEQAARVDAAIARQFDGFLDNLTDGIVLSQKTLERRINDSIALSDLVPQLGQQLFVPSIAGSKRLFIDVLARELVSLAALPEGEFRGEFYPLFFAPKEVDRADRVASGSIGIAIEGAAPATPTTVTLTPASGGRVRLRLNLFDELGGLTAPDAGLAVRFRLGGTANGSGDYTLSTGGVLAIATFQPGSTSTTIEVDVSAAAIADGSRYLQIEILGADSGFRVAADAAVATIAFGAAGQAAAPPVSGGRTDFRPRAVITREAGDDAVVRAPGGGDHVVLRGVAGEADLFVIGESQVAGLPFIENFDPADGDRILLFVGDLLAARRADWLADPGRRSAAVAHLRSTLGDDAVDRLAADALADLVASRIEAVDPMPAFAPSQINTYGGIVFDVAGKRPLASVSNYSQSAGDTAWGTMSTSVAAGIFQFGTLTLTTKSLPWNTAAGTVVGTLADEIPITAGRSTFELVPGQGDADNALFRIVRDDSQAFPQSFLVARGPFDPATNPRLSIRVRSTDETGLAFEQALLIDVTAVRLLAPPPGFSGNPAAVADAGSAVREIPIRFSTPVIGVTTAAFELLHEGKPVSLAGSQVSGSGANYTLTFPEGRTDSSGIYTLRIKSNTGIVAADDGATLVGDSRLHWGRGRSVTDGVPFTLIGAPSGGGELGSSPTGYAVRANGQVIPIMFAGSPASANNPGYGWTAVAGRASGSGYEVLWRQSGGGFASWEVDSAGGRTTGRFLTPQEAAVAWANNLPFTPSGSPSGGVELGSNLTGYAIRTNGQVTPLTFAGGLTSANNPGYGWTAIAARAAGSGSEVLWRQTGGGFARWIVDAGGARLTGGPLTLQEVAGWGNSLPFTPIGSPSGGVELGSNLAGYAIRAQGQVLPITFAGGLTSANNPGYGWTAIAARASGGGYEVLWRQRSGGFARWLLDASGKRTTGGLLTPEDAAAWGV